MSGEGTARQEDPVDELAAVIAETLVANALRLTADRGGYVGGGQPHATLTSDSGAVEAIARGLLARKVAEPSRALPAFQAEHREPPPGVDAEEAGDVLDFIGWSVPDNPADPLGLLMYCRDKARASRLRATPDRPTGLDVERLARAMYPCDSTATREEALSDAAEVAAEYARLATPTPEPE